MRDTQALVKELKHQLREQGITYQDVAAKLELSESSVKRLFSKADFTLERFEKICSMAGLGVGDLVYALNKRQEKITELTLEQEEILAADPKFLLVAYLVVNHISFEDILEYYQFDEHELIRYLAKMDGMKAIELLPGNKIKVLTTQNFHWRPDGPIRKFIDKVVLREFLNTRFQKEEQSRVFVHGLLTKGSIEMLQREIRKLTKQFMTSNLEDRQEQIDKRLGTSMYIAMRPWSLHQFDSFKRD